MDAHLIPIGTCTPCSYPIDAVKTRLQLQGQTFQQTAPRGAIATAVLVLRTEGAQGLYAGVTPAIVRHFFYTGTRISVYEHLRNKWPGGQEGTQPLGSKLLMGLTAGALGQMVAVPADLVKVQLQAESRAVAAGLRAASRYKGMVHVLSTIAAKEGVAGLWKGAVPAVQRAALVNLGELATYDMAKQRILSMQLMPDGLAAHVAASATSGLVATVMSTPADVIKTRMMGQDAAKPMYSGSLDCLVKSVRQEGFWTLYRGFFPTWMRLGPWQMVFWVSYEELRTVAGLASF